jgi:hypothetical protein
VFDITSVLPFDYFFTSKNYKSLVRIARIPKLYRLIKMTRLLRMFKVFKERQKLVKYINEVLKIGVGVQRLVFHILIFFVLCHIACCFWIMAARFNLNIDTWIV